MKKGFFVFLMVFVGFSAFAQNWSLGGEIYTNHFKWDNGETSDDTNEFYFGISAGRYFSEKISAGIKGTFDFLDNGNIISFGPFVQYDFLKYDLFSFGVLGSFLFSFYNDSYVWNDDHYDLDANSILLNGSILFNFTPNRNVELYMSIFGISYGHEWLKIPGYSGDYSVDSFTISSPINNVSLGIKFKI